MTLKGHTLAANSVSFSPNGKLLASGSEVNTIKIWDPSSGELLMTLKGHTGSVNSVSFSPNGKLLASGSEVNTIKLWDPSSGELLMTLKGHTGSVNSVSFSPDGKLLASGSDDNTIKIWDAVGQKGCLPIYFFDPSATKKTQRGTTYRSTDTYGITRTYTLSCGAPIPAGAICTCNCVPGTYSRPPSGRSGRICTCVPVYY